MMKNSYLTKRERVLNALHKKEVDRVPWSPLIGPYYMSSLPLQNIHMEKIEAMRYIGNDIIERHVAMPNAIFNNVNIRREKAADQITERVWYETPVGSVYVDRKPNGHTSFITHHMLETLEDIKVYQYIVEHMTFSDNIKDFIERERYIGDDGIATTSGPMSPIQTLLQFVAGIENTVYLMMDYPDEMDELLAVMHEANKKVYKILADYPTDAIFDYEDTSTTVMSKNMYVNYSAPTIDDYAKILHDNGKLFITHMCGKLNGFKEEIGKGIQDGVDSICPPETGDLYIWEARKAWGENKVVIGGIDPPAFSRMTVEESVNTAREIIEKMKGQKGFILSSGDAVSFGTPIENMIAITKLIENM